MCPWSCYFFPLSTQGEEEGEPTLRCPLHRPLKLRELNPISAAQKRANKGSAKCMVGGACHSLPDPKSFLSCTSYMQFELPHTSYKLPKSVSNLTAGFPGFFLCRLLPAFSSSKHPSPAKLARSLRSPAIPLWHSRVVCGF